MKTLLIALTLLFSLAAQGQGWKPKEGTIEWGVVRQDFNSTGFRMGISITAENNFGFATHFYIQDGNANIPYVSTAQVTKKFGEALNLTLLTGIATHKYSRDGGRDKELYPNRFYISPVGSVELGYDRNAGRAFIVYTNAHRHYLGGGLKYVIK